MSNVKKRDKEETNMTKIFGHVVLMATLLVGVYLSTGTLYSWADDEGVTDNIIASHDRRSPEYNDEYDEYDDEYDDECLKCHASVLSEQSLNPDIPTAHRAMLLSTPGDDDKDKLRLLPPWRGPDPGATAGGQDHCQPAQTRQRPGVRPLSRHYPAPNPTPTTPTAV